MCTVYTYQCDSAVLVGRVVCNFTTYIGWLLGCNVFIVQCMQYAELLYTDNTGLHYILTSCEDMFTTNYMPNISVCWSVQWARVGEFRNDTVVHATSPYMYYIPAPHTAHHGHLHIYTSMVLYVQCVCTVYTHQCDSAVLVGRVVCNGYYRASRA